MPRYHLDLDRAIGSSLSITAPTPTRAIRRAKELIKELTDKVHALDLHNYDGDTLTVYFNLENVTDNDIICDSVVTDDGQTDFRRYADVDDDDRTDFQRYADEYGYASGDDLVYDIEE